MTIKTKTSFHRWDLHSVLWENPPRVCSMLHECRVFKTRGNIRFTHHLYSSFYSTLLKKLFYHTFLVGLFLLRFRKSTAPSLPLSPPTLLVQNRWHCTGSCELCTGDLSEQHMGKKVLVSLGSRGHGTSSLPLLDYTRIASRWKHRCIPVPSMCKW